MPDDLNVGVVGTELEEDLFWTVPLVDNFLDEIFAMTQLKANWPFVALPARIAVYAQLHLIIVAQLSCTTGSHFAFYSLCGWDS